MPKRTPVKTTKHVSRKPGGMKQVALYSRPVVVNLTGTDPEELQKVAHHIHLSAASHPLVVGGKSKRKVHVCSDESFIPAKIFDGVC